MYSVTIIVGISRGGRNLVYKIVGGRVCRRFNPLTPNDPYSGRTAALTSKRCILYIYSTNTGTEYFKHGIYSPFFPLQNAVCFIILTYLVPVLFTFYIQSVLKLKKRIIPAPKGWTGLRTEKCVVRRFRRCANVIDCT